jgi:hypothetical protein
VQVDPTNDRGSYGILYSRADAASRVADARQPVDRAGPVENAQDAFPTRSLDAKNASTRSTGVLTLCDFMNDKSRADCGPHV